LYILVDFVGCENYYITISVECTVTPGGYGKYWGVTTHNCSCDLHGAVLYSVLQSPFSWCFQ